MEPPRVNPVGITEHPPGYGARTRRYPVGLRVLAAGVLLAFLVVGVATTVASLGAYCLTSDAADTRALPPRPPRAN